MARAKFNRERASRILVDAIAFGDRTAAKRWGITEKTIGRYRKRLESDRELSESVRAKGQKADKDWSKARLRSLRATLKKANELVRMANRADLLGAVTEHLRVLGELDIAATVLRGNDGDGDGSSDLDQQGPEPPEPAAPAVAGEGTTATADPRA